MKKQVPELDKVSFLQPQASRRMLIVNAIMAIVYFVVISFFFQHGNEILFGLLIAGEVFHVFQILGFVYTVWDSKLTNPFDRRFNKPVDVFITVCGEPVEIIRETVIAAKKMEYDGKVSIYILNDGYVANKDNWREVEDLAREQNIYCVTRKKPGGAKAGNINNAARHSKSPYIVVFDADHVPHANFLTQTMGFFTDDRMGFVQTPQFYKNQTENSITQTSWDQQTLFFGPIMSGKNRLNSAFMCGTNMILSRKALNDAGGMVEFNIAEDFLTSLFVHQKGWNSVYVPQVLAEGLAPEDFLSYYKQQFRWTRGSLEVIFKYNPLFMRGLTMAQRLQYLISASYYLSGIVVLINALIPLIFLYTGVTAMQTSSMLLATVFIPYIFLNLYALNATSNFTFTFNAIAFSLSSFYLQIKAVIGVLTNQKTSFAVTSKQQIQGNFLYLATPQILYIVLAVIGIAIAFLRSGATASLMANLAWVLVNVAVFVPFIVAAAPPMKRRKTRKQHENALRTRKVKHEATV